MIQGKELRLGNLLNLEGVAMEVAQINPDETIRFWAEKETNATRGCFSLSYQNIKPIPLTEEWLLKLGYKLNFNEYWSSEDGEISIDNLSRIMVVSGAIGHDNYYEEKGIKIQHVHHLPNLYFALTGEELKIIP